MLRNLPKPRDAGGFESHVGIEPSSDGAVDDGRRRDTGLVIGRQRSVGSGVVIDRDGYGLSFTPSVTVTDGGASSFTPGVEHPAASAAVRVSKSSTNKRQSLSRPNNCRNGNSFEAV